MIEPAPPLYQGLFALTIALTPIAITLLLVSRQRIAPLSGATVLLYWGLIIVVLEHATFGLAEFGGGDVLHHTGFHFQMLATYGLAALVVAGGIIGPLLNRADRFGWYGLLSLATIGVIGEVLTAAVTTPHGVPPKFWSWGLALWGYPLAWVVALSMSYRPIFRP